MFTLARQARQASEHAFGAGRAAGVEVPQPSRRSTTAIAEMKARIDKTVDFLKTLRPEQLDGKEDVAGNDCSQAASRANFRAQVYLYHFAMPNFYFHIDDRLQYSAVSSASRSASATSWARCRRRIELLRISSLF